MYAVCIEGHDKKGKAHYVDAPYFKYTDTIDGVINDAIEDITGAPWFCYVDSVSIKNTETSLMQTFELYTSNKEKAKIEVYSLVKGWITRDSRIIPEKKTVSDDEEDDDKRGDLASNYNELASKYNELASKYNAIAEFPVIIMGSEPEKTRIPHKLFI